MKSKNDLFVIGIGASVGGLEAIKRLFSQLDQSDSMAFVVIQHLSPDFKSLMAELLGKQTHLRIVNVEHNQIIEPNCIYLNESTKYLKIKNQKFILEELNPQRSIHFPIDAFFQSLAKEYGEKAVGVVLSGTGSDGLSGVKSIKESGGTIIVQDPGSTQYNGMPNAAISTNLVDFILEPEKIGQLLVKTIDTQFHLKVSGSDDTDQATNDELFINILNELHKSTGIDFKDYKHNTLIRRLEKRIHINGLDNLSDYYSFLKINTIEKEILMQDFLIGVTSFFRDIEAFHILRERIIPKIFQNRTSIDPIRIWVPGCSTGEEVYSIAILFDEYIKDNNLNFDFKIFATDIDAKAIAKASLGNFHINAINEIEPNILKKYFINLGDRIEIQKTIREKIVFSIHNILKDPPFIRMDLIACRNLLIYLNHSAQKKIFYNFQFALNKFGYLFLGTSESIGDLKKHFETIDSKWKIYRSISDAKPLTINHLNYNRLSNMLQINPNIKSEFADFKPKDHNEFIFHRFLSNRYSPSCIFIDKNYNILFIKGDAGKRLTHTEGIFERNLLKVVNAELASVIRDGISKLDKQKKEIEIKNYIYSIENEHFAYDLCFYHPEIEELKESYVIEFSNDRSVDNNDKLVFENIQIDDYSKQRIALLEDELKAVKTELQNVIEELETSNEELQSSNEELMSSNEELQGTNEELQSANEELYTVNAEFQEKNKELADLNNDVNNLLNSTDIGTLFLDSDLNIRKFTPTLQQHFKLQESDLGRPISSFASNFNNDINHSIINDSKKVLNELITIEKEIIDKDNHYYLKRISPFITDEKKIDGVVITFIDIHKLKSTQHQLYTTELKYKNLFANLNEGFIHARIILDDNGSPCDWIYLDVNLAFAKLVDLDISNIIGRKASELFPETTSDISDIFKIYSYTAITGEEQFIQDYFGPSGRSFMLHIFSPERYEFAATISDISELKQMQNTIKNVNQRLELAYTVSEAAIGEFDLVLDEITYSNNVWDKLFGLEKTSSFKAREKYIHADDLLDYRDKLNFHIEGKHEKFIVEYRYLNPLLKKECWISTTGKIIEFDNSGNPTKMMEISIDVTERKKYDERLRLSEQKFRKVFENSPFGMVMVNASFRFIAANQSFCSMLGYTEGEILLKTFKDITHPDDIANDVIGIKKLMEGDIPVYKTEKRYINKKGDVIWGSLTVNAEFDENGVFQYHIATIEDINYRKVSELQIKQITDRLELATKSSNIGIWDWDITRNKLIWDKLMYKIFAVDEEKFPEAFEGWLNCLHPDDREENLKATQKALNKLSNYESEFRIIWPDESIHWIKAYGKVLFDSKGKPQRMIGVNFDITARKNAEIEIKEITEKLKIQNEEYRIVNQKLKQAKEITEKNEKKYRGLFNALQEGVYLHELIYNEEGQAVDYRIIDGNPISEKSLNIPLKTAIGKLATELYGTLTAPFIDIYAKVAETGEPVTFDQYFEPMSKHFFITVFSTQKGQFATAFLDITETKKYEKALIEAKEKAEENEARFKAISEKSIDGITLTDVEGNYIFVNPAYSAMTGYSEKELYFMNIRTILHPSEKLVAFPETLKSGASSRDNVILVKKNKELVYADIYGKLLEFSNQKYVLGIVHDVTERYTFEKELITAKEKAEESDRFKTAFLQNISHEIRTPLNAIMGFSDLILKHYNNKEKLERFTSIIVRRSNDLLDIINDIIDISKIESGQLPINVEPCNLNNLLTELMLIITEYRDRLGKQDISIKLRIPPKETNLYIDIDQGKLKQIYVNLLTNALKYTTEGKIEFGYTYDYGKLLFFVSDTGIGIPPDQLNLIFERFVRLENATLLNTGGTGLGLSIVKGLVNLLGGQIWVDSEQGRGSTFKFIIPFFENKNPQLPDSSVLIEENFDILNKTILVVEDDIWNAAYIKEVLINNISKILIAETGAVGIELARNNRIDLVLMDIRLPDMTGYEAIDKIRETHPDLKFIIQTAFVSSDEKKKAIQFGCLDFISKPIHQSTLVETVYRHLSKGGTFNN